MIYSDIKYKIDNMEKKLHYESIMEFDDSMSLNEC